MAKIINPINEIKKEESKTNYKIERLSEMCDAMKSSLENIDKVNIEQQLLINVLTKSEHATVFEDLIKASKNQLENLNEQKKTLLVRYEKLKKVLNTCYNDKCITNVVCELLDSMGVFEE